MEILRHLTSHAPIEPEYGAAILRAYDLKLPITPIEITGLETQKLSFDALQKASEIYEALPMEKEAFLGCRFVDLMGAHALDWLTQSFRIPTTFDPEIGVFKTEAGTVKTIVAAPEIKSIELRPDECNAELLAIFQLEWLHCTYTKPDGQRVIVASNSNKFAIEFHPAYEPSQKETGGRIRLLGYDTYDNYQAGRGWGRGMSTVRPSKIRELSFNPSYTPLSFIRLLQGAERDFK